MRLGAKMMKRRNDRRGQGTTGVKGKSRKQDGEEIQRKGDER